MNKLKLSNLLCTKMACLQGGGGPQLGEVIRLTVVEK